MGSRFESEGVYHPRIPVIPGKNWNHRDSSLGPRRPKVHTDVHPWSLEAPSPASAKVVLDRGRRHPPFESRGPAVLLDLTDDLDRVLPIDRPRAPGIASPKPSCARHDLCKEFKQAPARATCDRQMCRDMRQNCRYALSKVSYSADVEKALKARCYDRVASTTAASSSAPTRQDARAPEAAGGTPARSTGRTGATVAGE